MCAQLCTINGLLFESPCKHKHCYLHHYPRGRARASHWHRGRGSECKNVGSQPPLITPPGTGHQQTFASNYQMTIIAECEDSHYLFLHCICSLSVSGPAIVTDRLTLDAHHSHDDAHHSHDDHSQMMVASCRGRGGTLR